MSKESWRKHIANQRQSGQSVEACCKNHGLKSRNWHYWNKKLSAVPTKHPVATSVTGDYPKAACDKAGNWSYEIRSPHESEFFAWISGRSNQRFYGRLRLQSKKDPQGGSFCRIFARNIWN